jgi:hypothetical protein
LIKARDRESAFRKAMKLGRLGDRSEFWDSHSGRKGALRFEGLTMLLPVYDHFGGWGRNPVDGTRRQNGQTNQSDDQVKERPDGI